MNVEALHKVFRTLDPIRIRILALLAREELAVQDLTQILGLAQSTVSRHLSVLRDAGLVADRRSGTFSYWSFSEPADPVCQQAWRLSEQVLQNDPVSRRDADALQAVLLERATRSRTWFDELAPEWDNLRRVFNDDAQRARAISRLVSPRLTAADIGTGTGVLAAELAGLGMRVIAVDHSPEMLAAAREKLRACGVSDHVELRHGEVGSLPLADGEVDAAFAHMVLHYLPSPGEALREMVRTVRPGGQIVVVDFLPHDREWMRKDLGSQWQGFEPQAVQEWFADLGLEGVRVESQEPRVGAGESPATFIASGTRPVRVEPALQEATP